MTHAPKLIRNLITNPGLKSLYLITAGFDDFIPEFCYSKLRNEIWFKFYALYS